MSERKVDQSERFVLYGKVLVRMGLSFKNVHVQTKTFRLTKPYTLNAERSVAKALWRKGHVLDFRFECTGTVRFIYSSYKVPCEFG